MRSTKVINWLSFVLVGLLAAGSFVLSYSALWDTAILMGVPPRLAWIWPLLVDFALIVFSLSVVRSSLHGDRVVWGWFLVSLYTVATVAFNVLHAPDNLTARIVAVVAPVSLFLSFETLMAMLKGEVRRSEAVKSLSSLLAKKAQIEQEMRDFQREAVKRVEGEAQVKRQELEGQLTQIVNDLETGQVELEALNRQIQEAVEVSQQAGQAEIANQQETIAGLREQVEILQQTVKSYEDDIEAKQQELAGMDNPVKIYVNLPDNMTIQDRQALVKKMLDDGLTQEQVASALGVSVSTVKNDKRAVAVNGNGRH